MFFDCTIDFSAIFNFSSIVAFNESKLNKLSDASLISGWKPLLDKNIKDKKASDKTIKALNNFKNMSSLKPIL